MDLAFSGEASAAASSSSSSSSSSSALAEGACGLDAAGREDAAEHAEADLGSKRSRTDDDDAFDLQCLPKFRRLPRLTRRLELYTRMAKDVVALLERNGARKELIQEWFHQLHSNCKSGAIHREVRRETNNVWEVANTRLIEADAKESCAMPVGPTDPVAAEDGAAAGGGGGEEEESSSSSSSGAGAGAVERLATDFVTIEAASEVAECLGVELSPPTLTFECSACCEDTFMDDLPSACEGLACDEVQSCALCPQCQMRVWKLRLMEPDKEVPHLIARSLMIMRPTQLLRGSVCADPTCKHANASRPGTRMPDSHGSGLAEVNTVRAILRRASEREDGKVSLDFVVSHLDWNLVHDEMHTNRQELLFATSVDNGLSLAGGSSISFDRLRPMIRVRDPKGDLHPLKPLQWTPGLYGDMCAYCRRVVPKEEMKRHEACNVMAFAQARNLPLSLARHQLHALFGIAKATPLALLWACVHFARGPEVGDDVVQCPCCGLQRACDVECTHYTCPACRTRVCRQCKGIHQQGPVDDPNTLSEDFEWMVRSGGVPFAKARPDATSNTWFDHNFSMRSGDKMFGHKHKARGIMFDCFLYESNAEEFDQRVEGDALRDIDGELRLARMWGPALDCEEQLRIRDLRPDSNEGSVIRDRCWRDLLRHLRATIHACTIPGAFGLMRGDHALADAWTSGDAPIFPSARLPSALPDGISGVLQVLPGKLAGIWASVSVSWREECIRVYGTEHVSFEAVRLPISDEYIYRVCRRIRIGDTDHFVLAELTWRDR